MPFFLIFEGRKPRARELVIISFLCAIGVAGHCAFFVLPQFKPVLALVIISTLVGWFGSGVSAANLSALTQLLEGGTVPYSGMITGTVGTGLLVVVAGLAAKTVLKVYRYMALYDVYTSCDPHNNVLYLVLSIFVGITLPVFLFICRKKDDGLPVPQESQPAYEIPQWNPVEPPVEPWQENHE